MSQITISVIIPTCHRNDLLALCLDRLAPGAQTLSADQYRVIVTDDGSQSTTEALICDCYPWAQWTAGPRCGPAANRNHGASLAHGEWLAFTDDDCLPSLGWLAAYVDAIQPEISVYEGKTTCKAGIKSPLYEAPINLTGGWLWSCNFLISRTQFSRMQGFDTSFTMPAMEDTDFRERLRRSRQPIQFIPAAVVDHPPRRRSLGWRSARKYEANVQYWHKANDHGLLLVFLLRHVKHQLHRITQFRVSWDMAVALGGLAAETCGILWWLPGWHRKFLKAYPQPEAAA